MSSTPFSTPKLFQNFLGNLHSRRLLLNTPLHNSPATTASAPVAGKDHETPAGENNFDANVVMIFSVLLCALICVVGLNSIIKCAVRYSRQTGTGNNNTRLANTGVKKKALKTFPTVTYTPGLKLPGLDTECVICLSEFSAGDRVRILPKCNHGFHISCIDKWLTSHSSCPTCRHCLLETCQKIVGCSQAEQPLQLQGIILPLEPEGLVRSYRGDLP